MDNNNINNFDDIPELSDELQLELKKEFTTDSQLPLDVDRAVLEGARAHFDAFNKRRKSPLIHYLRYAAAIVLVAISAFFVLHNSQTFAPQDVNRDGSVDILDAMTLAIHIRDKGIYDRKWDYNNDNNLSITDVQIVANKAVEINNLDQAAAARLNSQLAMIIN